MKKNGFTLVEILAVLVLIAAITILAVPSIINYINGSKNEISEVTKKIVFSGTELYLEKENVKLITNTQRYCVSLQTLVDSGLLDENISEGDVLEEMDLNKFVEVTYQFDNNLKVNKYNYQILNNCSTNMAIENGAVFYFDVTKGKVCNNYHEDNSKTGYNGTSSTKTTNNQNGCLKFYIFNDYEETERLNLLLDHNTTATVNWDDSGSNKQGPVTLLQQLKTDTGSWVGTEQPANYTDNLINKTINYSGYKARLITEEDVFDITDNPNVYFFTETGGETDTCTENNASGCLYNWLRGNCVGTVGYWTANAYAHNGNIDYAVNGVEFARLITYNSYNVNGVSETSYAGELKYGPGVQHYGLRPVIEIAKSNL